MLFTIFISDIATCLLNTRVYYHIAMRVSMLHHETNFVITYCIAGKFDGGLN